MRTFLGSLISLLLAFSAACSPLETAPALPSTRVATLVDTTSPDPPVLAADGTRPPGGEDAGSPPPPPDTPAPSQPASSATPPPPSPALTEWQYPTPGPGVGTPFSEPQRYIIHYVAPGESLAVLARRFQTTEAVLAAANGRQPEQGLLAGELLVVPLNLGEPAGLPVFEILYLTQSQSIAALAAENATTVEALRQYNALGDDDLLPVGRWLIVPLAGE